MSTATLDLPVAPARHRLQSLAALAGHPLALLGFITLLGGLIRFSFLDHPAAWGNEAKTYQKVCSSFDEMLRALQTQGFPPLHYEVLWLLGRKISLSITMLRLFPAICGTLMIPAMYFLARQIVSRRVAMMTALFTACSAWMIHYSRDGKMYAPLWLFVVLNIGCLMWWLRTGLMTAWLAWIAAGSMMVGIQAVGFVALVIQPLWMLTARRSHWTRGLMFIAGLAIICAGPIGYYSQHNKWEGQGIDWVEHRNRGIPALELAGDTTSAFFFNYAWIQEYKTAQIPPIITKASVSALTILLVMLALGAMPWRIGQTSLMEATEPWWRGMLWLAMWIFIPAYGFYLASVAETLPPQSLWQTLTAAMEKPWWIFLIAGVGFAAILFTHRWVGRAVTILLIGTPAALLIYALFSAHISDPPAGINLWLNLLVQRWFLWPAIALVPVVAWFYADITLRGRIVRLVKFVAIVATVIGLMCGMFALSLKIQNPLHESVWMPRYLGVLWPAAAISGMALLLRLPTRPLRWAAIGSLLAINLVQAGAFIFAGGEAPVDRIAREVLEMGREGSHLLVYTPQTSDPRGGRGNGDITGFVGKMYLQQYSGLRTGSREFRRFNAAAQYDLRMSGDPSRIASDAASRPDVNRIILWASIDPSESKNDPLLTALGPAWSRKSEIVYPVRWSWSWGWIYDYRRREYVRNP